MHNNRDFEIVPRGQIAHLALRVGEVPLALGGPHATLQQLEREMSDAGEGVAVAGAAAPGPRARGAGTTFRRRSLLYDRALVLEHKVRGADRGLPVELRVLPDHAGLAVGKDDDLVGLVVPPIARVAVAVPKRAGHLVARAWRRGVEANDENRALHGVKKRRVPVGHELLPGRGPAVPVGPRERADGGRALRRAHGGRIAHAPQLRQIIGPDVRGNPVLALTGHQQQLQKYWNSVL